MSERRGCQIRTASDGSMSTSIEVALCPECGAPSWNAALNPGQPCLPCKHRATAQPTADLPVEPEPDGGVV